jgi:hypothetical protein
MCYLPLDPVDTHVESARLPMRGIGSGPAT